MIKLGGNSHNYYLNRVIKWCRKMEASSLAKSRPGHSLWPPPKGVKLQVVLVSLSCPAPQIKSITKILKFKEITKDAITTLSKTFFEEKHLIMVHYIRYLGRNRLFLTRNDSFSLQIYGRSFPS